MTCPILYLCVIVMSIVWGTMSDSAYCINTAVTISRA